MVRKTTSIKIESDLWKKAKKLAIDRDMSVADFIENLIKNELKKEEKG